MYRTMLCIYLASICLTANSQSASPCISSFDSLTQQEVYSYIDEPAVISLSHDELQAIIVKGVNSSNWYNSIEALYDQQIRIDIQLLIDQEGWIQTLESSISDSHPILDSIVNDLLRPIQWASAKCQGRQVDSRARMIFYFSPGAQLSRVLTIYLIDRQDKPWSITYSDGYLFTSQSSIDQSEGYQVDCALLDSLVEHYIKDVIQNGNQPVSDCKPNRAIRLKIETSVFSFEVIECPPFLSASSYSNMADVFYAIGLENNNLSQRQAVKRILKLCY